MLSLISEKLELPDRYTLSPTAESARDLLLAVSGAVVAVSNPKEQADAAKCGRDLQGAIKEVAAARKELAQPLNEAASKLIELERDYLAPIQAEKDRLGRLVTAYQQAEAARVEAEAKQRQAELDRLAKIEEEQSKIADKSRNMGKMVQAEMAAHNANEARQDLLRQPLPELAKAKGAITKRVLCWRCTDVKALYAARPDLCILEPKPAAILACCDPAAPIDGLELWFEEKTSFRS